LNLLGIDFEDWFHPELIQRHIKEKDNKPTVVQGIDKILEWLRKNDTFATFFMVGELLESKPELLDKIIDNGHEIAFHTMNHTRLDTLNFREKFADEIKKFADLTKGKSRGFRAPTFSLNYATSWAIDILAENNYLYDSSIVPAKTKLYGIEGADTKPYKISSNKLSGNDPNGKMLEFPLLTTTIFGKKIPAGGGFYLRSLPLKIIKSAIRNCERENYPATFYIHSWELTPEFMPKIPLPLMDSFITYHNLNKAFPKMDKIIKEFKFISFERFIVQTS
jgi:polysaccharide deacetylase family protein (PEP-CTERM system associated)